MQLGLIISVALAAAPAASAIRATCDPNNKVCHGCTAICSHYQDDSHLVLDPPCHAKCQASVYNCIEGTLPAEEARGDRVKCIEEALLERIREDGDLIMKVSYDVPPTFEEFDQLHKEDGRIDQKDMDVAFDILDGGAAPDGTTIPTAKVNVVHEVFREADQDGDGVVTQGEFNAYAKGDDHMGHQVEEMHPSPEKQDIVKEVSSVGEQVGEDAEAVGKDAITTDKEREKDADLMQTEVRPKKLRTAKKHHLQVQKKEKKKAQRGMAYFQHLLRLGLRVYRAEEKKTHPISQLALEMYTSASGHKKEM